MRITYSALLTLLLANAVPSLVAAQDLSPNWPMPPYDQHLDHVVPIATVARVGGRLALANPRTVQDAQAEPFVLGAATLDLTNPSRATVTLTVTNTTDRAIPWNDLMFEEVRICGVSGQTHGYPTVGGRGGHPSEGEVPPGAKDQRPDSRRTQLREGMGHRRHPCLCWQTRSTAVDPAVGPGLGRRVAAEQSRLRPSVREAAHSGATTVNPRGATVAGTARRVMVHPHQPHAARRSDLQVPRKSRV